MENTATNLLLKIVSGGQTGVDRGALEAAIVAGIPHGGWCPRGRFAEDGTIPPHYQLVECESSAYQVRTERNVVDSDGTLILYRSPLSAGTALTLKFVRRHRRPHLMVNVDLPPHPDRIRAWFGEQRIRVLNVAGPRESNHPGIQEASTALLLVVLTDAEKVPTGERGNDQR